MTTFIYALKDPRTSRIRYVGKSNSPKSKRFWAHLKSADRKSNHKECWLAGLKSLGLKPQLEILDEVPIAEWQLWEAEYIRVFRALNFDLVNISQGGEGPMLGVRHSETTRDKMSRSRTGKPCLEATKLKISQAMKGRRFSPDTIEKMSRAKLGRPLSESHKQKLRGGHRR